jgi:protein-tyrosine phosphatase
MQKNNIRPTTVLFVCTGNICRSPLAQYLCQQIVIRRGMNVLVDSCGTDDVHQGCGADSRTIEVALKHKVDMSSHRAKQVTALLLQWADIVICMGYEHRSYLQNKYFFEKRIVVYNEFVLGVCTSVADPYYGGQSGFERMYEHFEKTLPLCLEKMQDLS